MMSGSLSLPALLRQEARRRGCSHDALEATPSGSSLRNGVEQRALALRRRAGQPQSRRNAANWLLLLLLLLRCRRGDAAGRGNTERRQAGVHHGCQAAV